MDWDELPNLQYLGVEVRILEERDELHQTLVEGSHMIEIEDDAIKEEEASEAVL